MTRSKRANEPCPVARTLDIVGDRSTILILRELLTNPSRRFQERPLRSEYVLTPKGRELGPALQALLVWGRKHTG